MENSNVTPLVPKDKTTKDESSLVSSLSPREIVSELDRFVVGQNRAKKAGIKLALIPKQNLKDISKITERNPTLFDSDFKVMDVDNINEVLKHVFI